MLVLFYRRVSMMHYLPVELLKKALDADIKVSDRSSGISLLKSGVSYPGVIIFSSHYTQYVVLRGNDI